MSPIQSTRLTFINYYYTCTNEATMSFFEIKENQIKLAIGDESIRNPLPIVKCKYTKHAMVTVAKC